jgi:hypothetical protein
LLHFSPCFHSGSCVKYPFSALGDLYKGLQDLRPARQDATRRGHHVDRRSQWFGEEQHHRRCALRDRGAEPGGIAGRSYERVDLRRLGDAFGCERSRSNPRTRQRSGQDLAPLRGGFDHAPDLPQRGDGIQDQRLPCPSCGRTRRCWRGRTGTSQHPAPGCRGRDSRWWAGRVPARAGGGRGTRCLQEAPRLG